MGNYTSRMFYNNDNVKAKSQSKPFLSFEKSYNCTPITHKRKLQIDPRSVTVGILRTPIDVNYIARVSNRVTNDVKKNLENNVITKPIFEKSFDINVTQINDEQCLTPKILNLIDSRTPLIQNFLESNGTNINNGNKLNSEVMHEKQFNINSLDPRSPANDFERTPILKIDHTNTQYEVFTKTLETVKHKSADTKENFIVWRDCYSPEISSKISTIKSNDVQHNSEISPEKEDIVIGLNNHIIKKSKKKKLNKKIERKIGFHKEIKHEQFENKLQDAKKENKIQYKLSPIQKYINEISWNRTPLSNRSNNNEKNGTVKMNSIQQTCQKKCIEIKY